MSSYSRGGRRTPNQDNRSHHHHSNNNNNNNNNNNGNNPQQPRLRPCKEFVKTGTCIRQQQGKCAFAHVIKLHACIQVTKASNNSKQSNYKGSNYDSSYDKRRHHTGAAAVSSAAIWESSAGLKIFTGSHDGYWRLWNGSSGNFVQEFEHKMSATTPNQQNNQNQSNTSHGKVDCVEVVNNLFYCGFEGIPVLMPEIPVGMVHCWNLSNPQSPPMELHLGKMIPYAHAQSVSCLCVSVPNIIISGSRDASICIWKMVNEQGFVVDKTLVGHAREVTGLVVVNNSMLWSSSIDRTIRLWDLSSGECQYVISQSSQEGHKGPITSLIHFEHNGANFVFSSSLDATIKAWNAMNGECNASEAHGMGVTALALTCDLKNNPLLLCGLENGDVMIRSLVQTQNTPAFCLLVKLTSKFTYGHEEGPVRCLRPGPSNTFLSGGEDGKLNVWQITSDFGI